MELIVNLIIVFAIIISILKRFNETAGKSDEIRTPRRPPPEALSEQMNRGGKKASPESQTEPVPKNEPERVTIEEVFKRFLDQQPPPKPDPASKPEPVHTSEPAYEPMSYYEPAKTVETDSSDDSLELPPVALPSEMPEPLPQEWEKTQRINLAGNQFLNFKAPDVIRGIVMSEILGPPVSTRETTHWQ